MAFLEYLERLARIPTAPYREQWISRELQVILGSIPEVQIKVDEWGNVIARLRRGRVNRPPVALVAHMDHPGFIVQGPVDGDGLVPVLFEGSVNDNFFRGARVRLFRSATDEGIPGEVGTMGDRLPGGDRNRSGYVRVHADPDGAILGMWDLAHLRRDGDLLHGRALDDLGGIAAILESFDRLSKRHEPADLIGIFTRAEEAGFRGALLLCADEQHDRYLPDETIVLSIEMSSERPNVPIGKGAVLRIGDRVSVFDPELCHLLEHAAGELQARGSARPLVRALMDGGTCEATAFNLFGFRSAGLCLPLGNYHNMDHNRHRIAEEYISLADSEDLVLTMTHLATSDILGRRHMDALRIRFQELAENAAPRLRLS